MVERCPDCAPVHKLLIYRAQWAGRWYVSCQVCGDDCVPEGDDGWYGRPTWAEAFALGVQHQQEEAAWVRNFG